MEPKYKVGDKVTIKNLRGASSGYRFGLNDKMRDMSGKTYTIRLVTESHSSADDIPDDGYHYKLEEPGGWSWASSMFDDSTTCVPICASSKDSSIDAFIKKKKCPTLDFNL